jgi:hypothetical protein
VRGFRFQTRGLVHVKGKGEMETYLVVGKETGSPAGVQRQPSSRSSLAAVVYGMVRARRKHTIKGDQLVQLRLFHDQYLNLYTNTETIFYIKRA